MAIVLGMNVGHDSGCCLVEDGVPKVAISEERLTRTKYACGFTNSLDYCLDATGHTLQEVDMAVFSDYGRPLPSHFDGGLRRYNYPTERCFSVNHHLSHAYSTFMTSPFDESLVVVIDGEGNCGETESYYIGRGDTLEKIGGNDSSRPTCEGIGRTYDAFTNLLGWIDFDAGKTMGLAPYGRFERFAGLELFWLDEEVRVRGALNRKYREGAIEYFQTNGINPLAEVQQGLSGMSMLQEDIAYFVQDRLEKVIIGIINGLFEKYKIRNLCVAGGVGLNSVTNMKILEETQIENLFVVPAANDRGQCLGNALYGTHLIGDLRKDPLRGDYFGRNYSDEEILAAVNKDPKARVKKSIVRPEMVYEEPDDIAKTTARLIADGEIVGLFQGGSELGPRALGNRSILCDPRTAEMKDVLNRRVKHRESFRPFAPSVLEERASEYFELKCQSPYMLLVPKVRPSKRSVIPAVTHIDNTGRVQTVSKDVNPLYHRIIKEFEKLTNVPVILNTSFNDNGEPIVETPADAVGCFQSTEIDALIIGRYLVTKNHQG